MNLAVELAEAYSKHYSDVTLAVSGGGSGLGIASLYNGQADIANSSRPLTDEEVQLFAEKGIKLHTHVFAQDATAIVVNSAVNSDSIDVVTLGKILSGEIKNWKSISGQDLKINIYGRQSNSGTHSFIRKKLKIKFSENAKEMNGNAQILEGIKADQSGIGYVGAGYLLHGADGGSNVKVLLIKDSATAKAISPLDHAAIKQGIYYFQRPLYQFIPQGAWEKAKPFIDFEKTPEGKQLITNSGYYAID